MLAWFHFGAYCLFGATWILKTLDDLQKWKKDTRILKYFDVSSTTFLMTGSSQIVFGKYWPDRFKKSTIKSQIEPGLFKFEVQNNCISNLDVIMAFVRLNAKEATTVAIRTLSALHGSEKEDFQKYLKDLGKF